MVGTGLGRAALVLALCFLGGLWGGLGCSKRAAVGPDCNNHLRDGSETDVDCGGTMCAACNSDKRCQRDRDCLSKLCNSDGKCNAPSCSDGIRNGSESDIDCGGPDCPTCGSGQICFGNNDCIFNMCIGDGGVCL